MPPGATANPDDHGRFKTPPLRDIASTGPYMHDGALMSLDEVVALYADLGKAGSPDSEVGSFVLSVQDRIDLVAFLRALSGED